MSATTSSTTPNLPSPTAQPSAADVYRILVALDYEPDGDVALREAVRIARRRPATELHVVHVLPGVSDYAPAAEEIDELNRRLERAPEVMRKYLEARLEPVGSARSVVLHARVGNIAEAVHQTAVDVDADVIVVGTHGRRGLQKLMLGSVAGRLAETAHCPVLVVHPKDYSGLERSAGVEPLCPDCARAREASDGEDLWCEFHARPHVRTHVYRGSDRLSGVAGTHDPGLIPPGAG